MAAITYEKRSQQVERWLRPALGERPAVEITRVELVELLQRVNRHVGETAHRLAGVLAEVYHLARDSGVIGHHPADRLTKVLAKQPAAAHRRMSVDSPSRVAEVLQFIDLLADHRRQQHAMLCCSSSSTRAQGS